MSSHSVGMEIVEDVVIVGAGIAGLTTALGLHRLGIRSLVLESSERLRITGFAFTTWENAWKALDAIGIGESLRRQHYLMSSIVVASTFLEKPAVSEMSFKGHDIRCVQRRSLLETLAKELPNGTIRFSSKVVSIDESDDHFKRLHLADGTILKTKVLIGCDGVNSAVAKWLGLQNPVFSGRSAIRGNAHFKGGHGFEPKYRQFVGKGVRSGFLPCDDENVYWFFTWTPATKEEEMEDKPLKLKQLVTSKLKDTSDEMKSVIEKTLLDDIISSPLRYRKPWELLWGNISKGNVCVAGDALHPMTPDIGQGGCLAMEDGVVLARCLGEALLKPGVEDEEYERIEMGLKKYGQERKWRSFDLITTAFMVGFIQQNDGKVLSYLRDNFMLRLSAMEKLKKSLKIPSSLDWSDPDPCQWAKVECQENRVTRIQIPSNNIGGTLPPELKNLTQLTIFEVMNNQINGPIPSLAGLIQLQEANFHNNNFSSFPSDFFTGLTSLTSIHLDNNPFEPWEIPVSLKEATSLKTFSANNANIKGKFPGFFDPETFPSLTELHLALNKLEGELPAEFSGSMIQSLWVNGQSLNGTIEVIQNMSSLTEVWLHENKFSGPLPDFSVLTQLRNLSLRDNHFTGIVPLSLVNLKSLYIVNLTNNELQGSTPQFADNVIVDMNAGSNRFCLDDPNVACDHRVNILLSILQSVNYPHNFADEWKGNDPCDNWLGIVCAQGNIVSLLFARKGLTGTISSNFSMLTSLKTLDLSDNNLTGVIPMELASLPNLARLDVSNNRLYGKIPSFRDNVDVVTAGNHDIGKDKAPTPEARSPGGESAGISTGNGEKKSNKGTVLGSIIGVVGGLSLLGSVICLCAGTRKYTSKVQSLTAVRVHRHHSSDQGVKITVSRSSITGPSETFSKASSGPTDVHMVESGCMAISIQVLKNVTSNFSDENVLGRGGFGIVYKGELHDGTKIAVKRMESGVVSAKGLAEFKSEIAVFSKVRHRHLVANLGYCLDGNERLLVYEYMPQGTLSRHLFNWKDEGLKPLEWTQRLTIALDVARGVEYLHGLAQQSFIHRDLKPSNILLGDDMRAKVADFGLVRLAPADGRQSVETRLAGTFGYMAPEYAVTGRVTTKVDVFSFGVILMELISGRKALDETQPEESLHLVTWFRRKYINKDTFRKVIDKTIHLDDGKFTSIRTVSELACHCCAREPYQRPDMSHVVNVLSSLAELWKPETPNSADIYGVNLELTLPQAMKKWQVFENSNLDDSSSLLDSTGTTQTSITGLPSGFADSFTSADAR